MTYRAILLACLGLAAPAVVAADAAPLVIGETFTIESERLHETRRINVYRPSFYGERINGPLPVLYVPDGGIHEDFQHIAGLVNISVLNGTMRPFLVVGIENTERRRDFTGPSDDPRDRGIAPRIGGSAAFRDFLREELIPEIETRYEVTDERAIIGESLAGLFVVETFLLEPELFDTGIAVDPSLWWNRELLVKQAKTRVAATGNGRTLWFAASSEATILEPVSRFASELENAKTNLAWHFEPLPDETHRTIYHPAAMKAFRALFATQD